MARSYLVNAVDVLLAAPVATPDLTITVDDATPLPTVPFYLVVDPFAEGAGREYMLCTAVNGNILTVTRNLDGSDSTTHQAGEDVRISYVAQILDDLWDEIESSSSLPLGGVLGDALRKQSSTDGDADWEPNVSISATAPLTPLPGDWWVDPTDDNSTSVWDGSQWLGINSIYLPLAGGTITGPIIADTTSFKGIRPLSGTDGFRIGMSSQNEVEIAYEDPAGATTQSRLTLNGSRFSGDVPLEFPGGTFSGALLFTQSDTFDIGNAANRVNELYSSVWRGVVLRELDGTNVFNFSDGNRDFYNSAGVIEARVTVTGMTIGNADEDVDSKTILTLGAARSWSFRQRDVGASSAVELYSSSNKRFFIGGVTAGDAMEFNTAMQVILHQPASIADRSTFLRNVMIAPSSLGGTTPAPTGGDGHILIKYTA